MKQEKQCFRKYLCFRVLVSWSLETLFGFCCSGFCSCCWMCSLWLFLGAVNETWCLLLMKMFVSVFQAKTVVRVTSSNAYAASPLIVAGYNVSGSVRSDGEPMKGVMFLLFSSSVSKEVMVDHYLFNMSMAINKKNQIASRFILAWYSSVIHWFVQSLKLYFCIWFFCVISFFFSLTRPL